MKDKSFYTVQEYCKIVGLNRNTVYKWIKNGHLDAMQKGKGGRFLIPKHEIPTYIRNQAHCTKCGDSIKSDEDSLCGNCI